MSLRGELEPNELPMGYTIKKIDYMLVFLLFVPVHLLFQLFMFNPVMFDWLLYGAGIVAWYFCIRWAISEYRLKREAEQLMKELDVE